MGKKDWIPKTCITCDKDFKVTPCRELKAKYCSLKCRPIWNKGMKGFMSGEDHYNWRGGVTKPNDYQRKLFHKQMQKLVFERDNYTCQMCGSGGYLQVDHIQSWSEYVDLRFSMDNCRTVCMDCHYVITYGKPKPKNIKTWGHNLKRRDDI